ncbi:transcriptional regulator, LuxR family [Cognatiyoonia koreensis]|uniref:Transcriptional regulator, LuxR family n=1 Tax=Cognatiyoonia koreensis TaxID=364200 RepID=A0A1I0NQI1_9RHOB|nr:autoinducer binding domain-containing protein [Cognatiyoonia koreensis]SEW03506.1 transcriptional regulator, LuxR family [Cognatiyoonia koreensis]
MASLLGLEEIAEIAPGGYYIALRVGFAFPVEEVNNLPRDWVQHYTQNRLMLFDPVIRWVHANTGYIRWSEMESDDPRGVMKQAQTFGLRYGAAIAVFDGNKEGQRSFGSFARQDREYTELEIKLLQAYLQRRHAEMEPPSNLTEAEIQALGMVKNGKRLKEIAHDLGVSEGAVKQRLKNAKSKLEAKTSTQAAAIAAQHGII